MGGMGGMDGAPSASELHYAIKWTSSCEACRLNAKGKAVPLVDGQEGGEADQCYFRLVDADAAGAEPLVLQAATHELRDSWVAKVEHEIHQLFKLQLDRINDRSIPLTDDRSQGDTSQGKAAAGSRASGAEDEQGEESCCVEWLGMNQLYLEARQPRPRWLLEWAHTRQLEKAAAAATMNGGAPADVACNLVGIFGKARQGKSSLMNILAGHDSLFKISHKHKPCTHGVDLSMYNCSLRDFARLSVSREGAADIISAAPKAEGLETSRDPLGPLGPLDPLGPLAHDIRLGFVDAEGMGDQGVTYDTRLFTPVLLHCKCVIFNWMGGVEKDEMLQLLFTLASAARRVDLTPKRAAGATRYVILDEDSEDDMSSEDDASSDEADADIGNEGALNGENTNIFGHLHIVFRDWRFQTDRAGSEQNGDDHCDDSDDDSDDDAGTEAAGTEAAGTEAAGTEAAGTEAAGTEAAGPREVANKHAKAMGPAERRAQGRRMVLEQLLELEPEAELSSARNAIRKQLHRVFASIDVWLLPPPSYEKDGLKREIKDWAVEEEFKVHLEEMRVLMAEQLSAPTRLPGQKRGVDAAMLDNRLSAEGV
jgi:hypothetical protein